MSGNGKNGKNGKHANSHAVEVRELAPSSAERHERFCQEYLLDLNATAAYLRVYPDSSEAAAAVSACQLLSNPKIVARVAALQAERASRVQVSLDEVLRELMLVGFSDARHFVLNEQGHLTLAEGARDEAWRAVASVKHKITSNGDFTTREIEFKLWPKVSALELLGKHINAFPNRHELSGPGGGAIPLDFTFDLGKAGAARLASGE